MGGLITTIEDFSKYTAANLNAWPVRDDPETSPIKRSSIWEMQFPWDFIALSPNTKTAAGKPCPNVWTYGYGLIWERDCQNRTYIRHSGGLPGVGSDWVMMPGYDIGVVTFTNLTYEDWGDMNDRVLYNLLAISAAPRRVLPASAILMQRKNELLKVMEDWSAARASKIFAANFFMEYFPDKLKAELADAYNKAGKIKKIGDLTAINQMRGYFNVEGEQADFRIIFTLTPQNPGLIQEYDLQV